MEIQKPTALKVVVIGDGFVGKTCLITAYGENKATSGYQPTVSDSYGGIVEYEGREIQLSIWDTAGQKEYANIRPLAYADAACFILCFNPADK